MRAKRVGTSAALVWGLTLLALVGSGCGGWQKFPGDKAVDLVPPDPPTNLAATGGDQLVDLTWDASPSTDVIEYYVYVKLDGAASWGAVNRVGNVTAAQITGLLNGELYRARVQAVDGFGNPSLPENAAEVTFSTLPGPPTDLAITAVWQNNALALDLEWLGSGSATVAGYTLFVSTDGELTRSTPIDAGDVEAYLL
ncbi:MAG: fibronectin type III domain-containing protein, partial [Planctomycetes bacterium]|nr:fibronectin type III domain-containing protein [Planctomycetota bacterium]